MNRGTGAWVWAGCLSLCVTLFAATGCSPYSLDGKVIAGPSPMVMVVSGSDPRLDQPGISGASVDAMIDPDKLSREHGGSTVTDGSGAFSMPIDQTGAGFLIYDVRVVAQATGYKPTEKTMRLPGDSKQLLIVLTPGKGRYLPPKGDILQDTMEKSRPYLND